MKQENPGVISVIIPVYNVEKYLDRCMRSVVSQEYRQLEIILVDDGSTDSSGSMCDSWQKRDSRVKVIHQKNRGLSGARNAGLDAATGAYISFIDSDDWVAADYFTGLLKLMTENNAEVSGCGFLHTSVENGNPEKGKDDITVCEGEETEIRFLKSITRGGVNEGSAWAKLYSREIIGETRFVDGLYYEDMVFSWEILQKGGRFVKGEKQKYFYYKNPLSITAKGFSEKQFDLVTGAEMIRKSLPAGSPVEKYAVMYVGKAHFSVLIKVLKSRPVDRKVFYQELAQLHLYKKELLQSSLSAARKAVLLMLLALPYKKKRDQYLQSQ